jgi:hypothetical protein
MTFGAGYSGAALGIVLITSRLLRDRQKPSTAEEIEPWFPAEGCGGRIPAMRFNTPVKKAHLAESDFFGN